MRKSNLTTATTCKHIGADGYRKSKIAWENKRLGRIFSDMRNRCYNTNDPNYHSYGGRRIKICDEWLRNPKLFEEWSLRNGYEDTLTIDRKSSFGNYEPDNCRWVTSNDNSKYKSSTRVIHVGTMAHTGKEWARICEVGCNVINTMLREYGLQTTVWFIRARLNHPNLVRRGGNQPWIDVYKAYIQEEELYDKGVLPSQLK